MEDKKIIDLYWERNQRAIPETSSKYGQMCTQIAENILSDKRDAEECVNDTYLGLWNAIPPTRPRSFSAFVAKITRNLAIKRTEFLYAQKRTANATVSFSELDGCVPQNSVEDEAINSQLIKACIEDFILGLPPQSRYIFLRRYFFFDSVSDIAVKLGIGESAVKSSLLRSRKKLKVILNKEEIYIGNTKIEQR